MDVSEEIEYLKKKRHDRVTKSGGYTAISLNPEGREIADRIRDKTNLSYAQLVTLGLKLLEKELE